MKEEILKYLNEDRTYAAGVALYIKYGKKESFKRRLNSQIESTHLFGILLEELRQVVDIHNVEFQRILNTKVQMTPKVAKKVIEKEVVVEPKKLSEVPEYVKKTIRLREELPFLKEKDCPKELKILVNDMLTAYDKYREAHKELFETASTEEIASVCGEILDNYIENREIWEELTYYKENGKVLGKHPVFALEEMFKGLKDLSAKDLAKRAKTLDSNIRRDKGNITKNKRPDLLANRQEALFLKEQELAEINRLLGSK